MKKQIGLGAVALAAVATMGMNGSGATAVPGAADSAKPGPSAAQAIADARNALAANPRVARQTEAQQFNVRDVIIDANGTRHVRMDRTVHGLRVLGGDLVVHQAPGDARSAGLDSVSQTLKAPLDLGVKPRLTAVKAESKALKPGKVLRDISKLRAAKAKPELVIDAHGATPRLAWAVLSRGRHADGTPSRLTTYVDAKSGAVLRREEGIKTIEGEGESLYSGTVDIDVQQSGSNYRLTDPVRGNATTTDMQNRTDSFLCTLFGFGCSNGVAFNSPDTSFGNGSNSNRESAAVDAHYGAAVTYDYFELEHGREGIFGNGTGAPSRVHYGNNYVNAFWDGSKMTYGDGDGVDFGPLVSLDVAGHEMTHGITENTANLTYSGESGGLNEATSDIFGTMVEFYAANSSDPGDYFIGEEFDLAEGQGFRRMDDPQLDGNSQSCYSGSTGSVDVHYSSGVGNHFFYLLAEGSGTKTIGGKTHTSPTCNGSTINGIGRDAAAAIWFRALDVYMTSGTNYAQARTATLNAATDLYGAGSAQRNAVAAAWSAVNVS